MQRHRPPFTLNEFKIEVTYRCDLNCIHCSSDARWHSSGDTILNSGATPSCSLSRPLGIPPACHGVCPPPFVIRFSDFAIP